MQDDGRVPGVRRALPTAAVLMNDYVRAGRSLRSVAADHRLTITELRELIISYGLPLHHGVVAPPSGTGRLTASFLRAEYVEAGRSVADIAAEVGVSEQSVLRYLHRHGIPLRGGARRSLASSLTASFLRAEYVEAGRSVADIAAGVGVSEQSVLRYLHRHGIPLRRSRRPAAAEEHPPSRRRRPVGLADLLTEVYLREQYLTAGRSSSAIAAEVGVSEQSVLRYLHRYEIPVRPAGSAPARQVSRRWLMTEYVERGRSLSEIGQAAGVSGETVRKWLIRYGIERRARPRSSRPDDAVLLRRYRDEGRSLAAIAREVGVSATTVAKWLDEAGIASRRVRSGPAVTRELLDREYVRRGRSMAEIAQELGISPTTVRKHLDRFGIEVRKRNAQPLLERILRRDFLEREYVEKGRTARALAIEVGVSEQTILRYLHRHGLPVRPAGFKPSARIRRERTAPEPSPGADIGTAPDLPGSDGMTRTPAVRDWSVPDRPVVEGEAMNTAPPGHGHLAADDGAVQDRHPLVLRDRSEEEQLRSWLLGARAED